MNLSGQTGNAVSSDAIAKCSPVVAVENVQIYNFSEYQDGRRRIVERVSLAHLRKLNSRAQSIRNLLIRRNEAQAKLVGSLQNCIEIGVSIPDAFYCVARTHEALFGKCLSSVLEQYEGINGIRSSLKAYSIRCYPRALIETRGFFSKHYTGFCGIGGILRNSQPSLCDVGLSVSQSVLKNGNYGENAIEKQKQDCVNDTEAECPVYRRAITAYAAFFFCVALCWWGCRLMERGRNYWGWAVCWFGLGIFNSANILLFLSAFSWTWAAVVIAPLTQSQCSLVLLRPSVLLLVLRCLPRRGLVNALTTYELRVSQPLPDNTAKRLSKSASVIVFALVKRNACSSR